MQRRGSGPPNHAFLCTARNEASAAVEETALREAPPMTSRSDALIKEQPFVGPCPAVKPHRMIEARAGELRVLPAPTMRQHDVIDQSGIG